MKLFLLCLILLKFSTSTESVDLKNLGKAAVDVTKSVVEKIPDVIPSPSEFFEFSKNVIAGYPFELVSLKVFRGENLKIILFTFETFDFDRFFRQSTLFVSHLNLNSVNRTKW